jgi:diguanylate cyclase (GGDEF)-like protein
VGIDLQGGHHYSNLLIPVWNTLVRLGFFLIVSSLLSRIKTHLAREEALSRTDVLTGINNARAFREWLNHYLSISARQQQPIALGYIDLDNFKHVNDSQGHSTGDEVIKSIGRMLGTSVRTTDIVGRIGGDEFGIILPNANSKDTQTVFSKLHEKLTTEMTKSGWPIGVSIGGAIFITPPSSADEALKAADALMYDVKKSGKNQIRIKEFT